MSTATSNTAPRDTRTSLPCACGASCQCRPRSTPRGEREWLSWTNSTWRPTAASKACWRKVSRKKPRASPNTFGSKTMTPSIAVGVACIVAIVRHRCGSRGARGLSHRPRSRGCRLQSKHVRGDEDARGTVGDGAGRAAPQPRDFRRAAGDGTAARACRANPAHRARRLADAAAGACADRLSHHAAGPGRMDRVARRRAARPARGDRRRQSGAGVRAVRRRRAAAAARRGRRRLRDRRQLADREPALGRARTTWRALVGDAPAREIARFGSARRQGDPRGGEDARRLRPARRPPGRDAGPASRRRDEAPRPADLHLGHGLSLRSGRARAVELSPALGPRAGPRPQHRPAASTAPRGERLRLGAGDARARSSSSSARCCRPGAT